MWCIQQVSLLLTILIVNNVNADFCNCGLGPGESMCAPKTCVPLVVRPVDVPKPPAPTTTKLVYQTVSAPAAPLVPQPGLCSCTKAVVKPAVVPRPVCTTCYRKAFENSHQGKEVLVNEGYFNTPYGPAIVDQYIPKYGAACAPVKPTVATAADPVSMAIAYKMAQNAYKTVLNEDRLSFGFRKMPKELPPIVKKTNNIPEENLYKLNGQIVELKPVSQCTTDLDEEAAEELLAMTEDVNEPVEIRKVSLGELGYAPAKQVVGSFAEVASAPASELVVEQKACNDGFVPGNVVFQTIPKPAEKYEFAAPPPCELVSEVDDLPAAVVPCAGGVNGYFKSSKTTCQTNHAKEHVFYQKLGCY